MHSTEKAILIPSASRYWVLDVYSADDAAMFFHECDSKPSEVIEGSLFDSNAPAKIKVWLQDTVAKQYADSGRNIEPYLESYVERRGWSKTIRQPIADEGGCENVEPEENTFCHYRDVGDYGSSDRCPIGIYEELLELENNNPSFVQTVNLGTTHGDRDLLAIRIGKLTEAGDAPSPQAILIAGQHGSREGITSEIAMRTIRYYIDAYANQTDDVDKLLADRTLTIVPVLNPDGYDAYFLTGATLRNNGNPCVSGSQMGIDLNRNHPVNWGEGDYNLPLGCGFAGTSSISEPETMGIVALIGHNTLNLPYGGQVTGSYATGVVTNIHSAGNVLSYPTGLDANSNVCGVMHNHYTSGFQNSNCTPPDQDMLQEIFGTQRPSNAVMHDERVPGDGPYENGSKGRVFNYGSGGMLSNHALYGPFSGTTRRTLASLVEMTRNPCGGALNSAIGTSHAHLQRMEDDMIELARRMVEAAPKAVAGTLLNKKLGHYYAMPHIHRTKPDLEHPRLRISAHTNIQDLNVQASISGTAQLENMLSGTFYRLWAWGPAPGLDPYQFSTEYRVCPGEEDPQTGPGCQQEPAPGEQGGGRPPVCVGDPDTGCGTATLDEGVVDLCSPGGWSSNGFSFTGKLTPHPSDQCFWESTSSGSSLVRDPVDLEGVWTRLIYSFVIDWGAPESDAVGPKLYVEVSNNGFQNCSQSEGTGCRIIHIYHRDLHAGRAGRNTNVFLTETFDLHDFDLTDNVQVRFRTENFGGHSARLYDVHFAGWKP